MQFKLFPSFFDKPQRIRFVGQEPTERIELFLRQHVIVNIPWIFFSILGLFVPPIVIRLDQLAGFNIVASTPPTIIIAAIIVWYMLLVAYVLERFTYWYFNIYIVTNVHVVDVDFISLLSRKITEIELKDIESVSADIKGVFGPLFNFGDVEIETAAKEQAVRFEKVPKPDVVADRIDDLRLIARGGGE
jgi:hypothetical protein